MKSMNQKLVPLNNRPNFFANAFVKVSLQSLPSSWSSQQVNLSTLCLDSSCNFPSHSCVPVATKRYHKLHAITASASSDPNYNDDRIDRIASTIRVIPGFPKPGILFQDITTLLLDPKAFKDTIDLFVERYEHKNISVVAGIEARGFIFGPPIALAIGAKFVPMRKPNKLPGEVISEEYSLEYGTDIMEMHVGAVQAGERVLIIDDLIATGGTLCAAMKLVERVGAEVVECACVIELTGLKGREKLSDKPLFILITAPGE
ncbi:adenine phosphoribosyltransferase 1-like [Impatiens glandulifera]|uniref:adenine phosphoribosyltransferase 1-like n=1 Tax=Impatiens glandulifera TaxID=253017 RepID=UPI001FB0C45A|nr:adenine phosphoribosyltransferase 1-like [Impatiens glandulifera]